MTPSRATGGDEGEKGEETLTKRLTKRVKARPKGPVDQNGWIIYGRVFGVRKVQAQDWKNLGYGTGYASHTHTL